MTGNRVTEAMIELADKAFNDAVGKTELAPWPTMTERWTAALEAAFAAAQPSDDEVERPRVERIQTVSHESGFETPAPAMYRVIVGPQERCFDFDTEHQANLLSLAISEAIAALSSRPQASVPPSNEVLEDIIEDMIAAWICDDYEDDDDSDEFRDTQREYETAFRDDIRRLLEAVAPRPQAGMISADRACEMADELRKIHSALERAIGDTDIAHLEDDELRDSAPVQWAAQRLFALIETI